MAKKAEVIIQKSKTSLFGRVRDALAEVGGRAQSKVIHKKTEKSY